MLNDRVDCHSGSAGFDEALSSSQSIPGITIARVIDQQVGVFPCSIANGCCSLVETANTSRPLTLRRGIRSRGTVRDMNAMVDGRPLHLWTILSSGDVSAWPATAPGFCTPRGGKHLSLSAGRFSKCAADAIRFGRDCLERRGTSPSFSRTLQ
jgi:hypothetical protein